MSNWLRRRCCALSRDERGLSTVEYVILLVLVATIAIGAWRLFGDSVVSALQGTTGKLSDTFSSSLSESDTGLGSAASSTPAGGAPLGGWAQPGC